MDRRHRRWIGIGAAAVWALLLVGGVREIYGYETTSGARGGAPEQWPATSSLARNQTTPTLIMFVHPECPCSRASLDELAKLDARGATIVLAYTATGEHWDRARELGFSRRLDPGGLEAARFGAATSGHVVVYDAAGALRYAGGITGSRGHAGDNVGRRTVQAILDGGRAQDTAYPVFGCAL